MKIKTLLTLIAGFGVLSLRTFAQDGGGPPPEGGPGGGGHGGPGGRHPVPAIIKALDANHDGVIDASEITNAVAVLLTLDKDGDGKLTRDEYLGKPPGAPDGSTNAPTGRPRGGHHPPMPAIVSALDVNHDGVIDADEIANAVAVLQSLDKNGDGKLTRDEYLGKPSGRPPMGGDDMGGPPPQDGNGAGGPPDGGAEGPPPQQQ